MKLHQYMSCLAVVSAIWLASAADQLAVATVVRYDTSLGVVDVRLFDTATPLSVANFVNYATSDRWDGTFIHRSIPGFIVQGGGFSLTPDIFNTTQVTNDPPVLNEPVFSNLRGTVAYAKLGGDPNSATGQWFFNLSDNSANLDNQNGGFTAFGRVLGNGMDVIDDIAALRTISAGGAFTNVPVTDFDLVVAQQNIFASEAVIINDISVLGNPEGDYNLDGTVDQQDLSVWQSSFGSTVLAEADGNGNGIVDSDDFLIWQQNVGASSGAIAAGIASVPEPSTLGMGLLALLGWTCRRSGQLSA